MHCVMVRQRISPTITRHLFQFPCRSTHSLVKREKIQPILLFATTAAPHLTSPFFTIKAFAPSQQRTMASDADYMAFLDKANRQREAGSNITETSAAQRVHTETVQAGVEVPPVLGRVNAYYTSETDEPFEPVALRWGDAKRGIWPDKGIPSLVWYCWKG